MSGFDIARTTAAACEGGYTFTPRFPDGTPMEGVTITVRGPRSAAVRAHAAAQYARAVERDAATRRQRNAGARAPERTLEEIDEDLTALAVAYTAAWTGFASAGAALPCTPEAAREAWAAHPWLREQVIEEAQALGNFIRPPSASSTSTPPPSSPST